MRKNINVGSRGSKLALIQAESVVRRLTSANPGLEFSIKKIVTTGDRDHLTKLDRIGVDVFVKELEEALLDGRIDLAVHSLKDVPTQNPQGLGLVAVLERDDPRDVLVAKNSLDSLLPGSNSKIGTGSLRRTIQLSKSRPDLEIYSIRGNIDTRLRKVSSGELDGVILAAAAMLRMGWQDKITQYLPLDNFLPAAGQGALTIEARLDDQDAVSVASSINHIPTWQCVTAERAFLQELGGGCRAPIASLGKIMDNRLKLEGMVANIISKEIIRDSIEGDASSPSELGIKLARKMLGMGAREFIATARLNEAL